MLADADMLRARTVHGSRGMLMPGCVVEQQLLDMREGSVRTAVVRGALLIQADMLGARAMHRGGRVRVLRRMVGRQLLDMRQEPVRASHVL